MREITQTRQTYDAIALEFAAKNYTIDMSPQRERFLKLLPSSSTARPLLDLGCGPGRDTLALAANGYRVVGADISAAMLIEAQRRVPEGLFVGADMRQLPFGAGVFSGVWACASFLHLPKKWAGLALDEMYRVLAGNGGLFLGVKRGLDEGWQGGVRPRFFALYLPSEIRNLVEDHGFEVRGMAENFSATATEADGSPVRWINLYALKPGTSARAGR